MKGEGGGGLRWEFDGGTVAQLLYPPGAGEVWRGGVLLCPLPLQALAYALRRGGTEGVG